MLNFINANAKKPDQVALLTREGCPHCARAKALLTEQGLDYAEIALPSKTRSKVVGAIANRGTVPQVFINGEHIGGADELEVWIKKSNSIAA